MVMVSLILMMEQLTRVNSNISSVMDKGLWFIQMEKSILEIGLMELQMDTAHTSMRMEEYMKGNGKMINGMVLGC